MSGSDVELLINGIKILCTTVTLDIDRQHWRNRAIEAEALLQRFLDRWCCYDHSIGNTPCTLNQSDDPKEICFYHLFLEHILNVHERSKEHEREMEEAEALSKEVE